MKNSKTVFINYCLPIISVIFLAGLAYAEWTPPPVGTTPPADNVEPPITSGDATAYKTGALGVGGLFETDVDAHLALLSGKVGIGTTTPKEKFQVIGKALADDFCLNSDSTKCLSSGGGGGGLGSFTMITPAQYNYYNGASISYPAAIPSDAKIVYLAIKAGTTGAHCQIDAQADNFSRRTVIISDASNGNTVNYGFFLVPYSNSRVITFYNNSSSQYCHSQEGFFMGYATSNSGGPTPSGDGGSQLFSSSGAFIVPAGVTAVTIQAWGGGGGGGGGGGAVSDLAQQSVFVGPNIGGGGGGGGSGGYKKATVSVTSGDSYTVTIGAGGNGGGGGSCVTNYTPEDDVCGNSGDSGGNGGLSAVGGLVSVSGGSGGQGGHPACRDKDGIGGFGADGGNGGTAGENGLNGAVGNKWSDGGAGGFSVFGHGGSGRGGGIGAYQGGTTGALGDRGADGFVVITW
ncbi:hypothetical protein HY798_00885 [Candidatus Falkowbacteria bacterium]|nr:hypothetical protein [Candidatus Falkowbacteria bacterium]